MKKKYTALLLIFCLLSGMFLSLTSCSDEKSEDITAAAHAEGSVFSGKSDGSIGLTVKFNPDWLTQGDNTEYDPELAAFSALLSADSYFREKDLDKGTQNRVLPDGAEDYTFTTLLTTLGFTDTQHVESYKERSYETDTNDSVTMNLAHTVANEKYDIYVAAIRGCFSAGEWMSAFDAGSESDDTHPEWKNRSNMKGVDVAANRAFEFISDFIYAHNDPDKPNFILITGHSRGAAISEVLGAMFEDMQDITSYTYAFNSMAVTTDSYAQNYRTIFNIFDSGDLYTDFLPFGQEQFYRYGKVLTADISSSDEIRNAVCESKGGDFISASAETIRGYAEVFGNRFSSRDSLTEALSASEDFGENGDEADKRLSELNAIISSETGLGLEGLCSAEKTETDGKYTVTVKYSNSAALFAVGKIFAYGKAAADAVCSLFSSDSGVCETAEFITEHSDEMSGGHLLINSYILCGFLDYRK